MTSCRKPARRLNSRNKPSEKHDWIIRVHPVDIHICLGERQITFTRVSEPLGLHIIRRNGGYKWSVVSGQVGRCPWFFLAFYPNQFFGTCFFLCRFIGHNHLEFIQIAWIRRKSSSWMRPKDIHTHIHSPVYDRFYEYFFVNFLVFVLLLRRCPNFGRVEP